MTVRFIAGILVAVCFAGGSSVACQQETPPSPNSAPETSAPTPAQAESKPQPSKENTAAPAETKPQPWPETAPPKKQPNGNKTNSTPRRRSSSKAATEPASAESPRKVVVREGGVEEPTSQIVTGMKRDEAARKRDEAELLLSTTAEKLKEIAPRPLDARQQETVSQIHSYMEVARAALKEGAISRAHTLAEKASLLANDLARH